MVKSARCKVCTAKKHHVPCMFTAAGEEVTLRAPDLVYRIISKNIELLTDSGTS
jgi:hypothetical protein